MKKVAVVSSMIIGLLVVSIIGVGVAYTAMVESDDNSLDVITVYCTAGLDQPITSIIVPEGTDKAVSFYHKDVEDSGKDVSEDRFTLSYKDIKGQSGIVCITITGFKTTDADAGLVLSIYEHSDDHPGGSIIGSCRMVPDGDKLTGTISGIGPISSGGSMILSAKVTGTVSSESSLDMSIAVYPIREVA